MSAENTTYTGGCHCGAVRFSLVSPPIESAMECNCSHCAKKGLLLTFVPRVNFTLSSGEEELTEYTFNKKVIKHQFCQVCGTEPFAYGQDEKGNEMAAINVRCLDDFDISAISRQAFNGKDV